MADEYEPTDCDDEKPVVLNWPAVAYKAVQVLGFVAFCLIVAQCESGNIW